MKSTKFILCDCYGNKIYLGDYAYFYDGYCGVYCSDACFAEAFATMKILDDNEADNCGCEIFDDNLIENECATIINEISILQRKLDKLCKLRG